MAVVPTTAVGAAAANTSPFGQALSAVPKMRPQTAAAIGGQPQIGANPIYSPDQISAQVNTAMGMNNASAQSGYKNALEGLAGRGFGSNSPQQAALKNRYNNQAMVANMQARTQIPFQYAKDNAVQQLAGQQAQEAQYGARQTEDIGRMRDETSRFQSILGMLGTLF